ncbi:hypothetical protein Gotri_007576 [Gossypium trilobum]|uniref:Uncharacterized protein n=1 Tax=Gossypium trilobum TaxID=34281 RepID=A0A7J9EI49_9ROSI|nr:hypothetical protein [Gossypium trilobum]
MINYVDQGVIASNGVNGSIRTCDDKGICTSGSGIQGEFDLTNFQDGLLSSAFMVGLLVASPIFASLTKSHHPFRLIGVGLSVWTLAAAGCGSAFSFGLLQYAACKCSILNTLWELVGVGEASFISLAAPFIDDTAPVSQVGSQFNWRYAFWGEALLMLPFAVFGFAFEPLQLKGLKHFFGRSVNIHNILNQFSQFAKDMKALLVDKVYAVNIFGYIAYNFIIGAYSYWGPKAGYNIYHMENAVMMFGGITIVCGILGTLSGGFILDRLSASIYKAFIAPVNYASLHCVKPSLRPLSMAISTVSIHIFGDVPSSPLMGVLQLLFLKYIYELAQSHVALFVTGDDVLEQDNINNWRASALILTSILFLAAGIWFIGVSLHSDDASNDRSESQVCTVTVDNGTPLLYGNGDESSYEA